MWIASKYCAGEEIHVPYSSLKGALIDYPRSGRSWLSCHMWPWTSIMQLGQQQAGLANQSLTALVVVTFCLCCYTPQTPGRYSQLMWGLWMLSTRSVWDSCLESDGTTESEMMKCYKGPVWLHCPISYRVDASRYLGMWLDLTTHLKRGSSAPYKRIIQPTSWPHVVSATWSSTEQVARPATKRFHPSDWRPLEACCRPWTWWCNDATALAGYATKMMMMSIHFTAKELNWVGLN